jgi:hypothetical protein
MHVQTHILSGWCIGNLAPLTPRQRLLCMMAASLEDLDGLGIVLKPFNSELGQNLYWDYHHTFGHCILFGILMSGVLAALSKQRRVLCFILYLLLFHLHLALDVLGSGRGWEIVYFWPMSHWGYGVPWAWALDSWQNKTTFAALLVWTIAIARWQFRTPLELLMPSLDRQLIPKRFATENNATPAA